MVFIHRVEVPASLDAPGAWTLREIARLDRESSIELAGHDDFAASASEQFQALINPHAWRSEHLLALSEPDSHTALGWVSVQMPLLDNLTDAWVSVVTDVHHRRRGIGQALYDAALAIARAAGRTTIRCYTYYGAEPAPGPGSITAPTGAGRMPADGPSVRFVLANGFRLGMVERASDLNLPADGARLAELHEQALAAAGDAYRTVQWVGACPPEYIDQLAELNRQMSRDIPQGELGMGEEVWDAQRIRVSEERAAKTGATWVITAAQHIDSGKLVAYTHLAVPGSHPEAAFQENTIVLGAHRGHRLGLLVKLENLDQLVATAPRVRRIHTWNAEENQHMLAINTAMGFKAAGVEGQWVADLG